jgi:hypothetical protein
MQGRERKWPFLFLARIILRGLGTLTIVSGFEASVLDIWLFLLILLENTNDMKHIISTLVLLAVCLQAAAYGPESTASIYVKAGMGTRLGKAAGSTELDRQHAQKLSKGFSAQFELVLNRPSIITAGFIVNDLHSSATDRVVVTYTDGSKETGDMTDVADIWSFAPATYLRGNILDGRLGYSWAVGMGIMGLRDKGILLDYSVLKTGWCMGGMTEVGFEYNLTPTFSIGFNTNMLVGDLTSYNTKDLSTGNVQKTSNVHEAISHIDVLLSVSFAF